MEGIKIRRDASAQRFKFKEYFQGFEKCSAVIEIFGKDTEKVLNNVTIEFNSRRNGYMGVSDVDGHIFISTYHLKNSNEEIIYLDIIHELFHVKQFMEGRDLFDPNYEYVDRPTEIEAYLHTVKEARRIGLDDKEIFDYLETDWIDNNAHKRLASHVGVKLEK